MHCPWLQLGLLKYESPIVFLPAPYNVSDNSAICGDWLGWALVSSDQCVICVHRHRISCTSHNAFTSLLTDSTKSPVPPKTVVCALINLAVLYDVPAISSFPPSSGGSPSGPDQVQHSFQSARLPGQITLPAPSPPRPPSPN